MSIASSPHHRPAQPRRQRLPVPAAPDAAANAAAEALQREAQLEALQAQVAQLQEILAKPLTEILAEHDKAAAPPPRDSFGRWMLSRHAPRGDGFGGQQGVSEQEVVARAWPMPTRCSMSKTKTWRHRGLAQLAHIARQ